MTQPIQAIDITEFESASDLRRAEIANTVMSSLETGFVYVRHDVDKETLDDMYDSIRAFFSLDSETKAKYARPDTFGQRGYTPLLVETAATSDAADLKEMYNFGAALPPGHPLGVKYPHRYASQVFPNEHIGGAEARWMNFHHRIADLQLRFLRIVALGLGVDSSFFDDMCANGTTLTRCIHYPSMDQAPGQQHVWAAAHGDINLITALPRATAKGLQVDVDGQWIDVEPPADHAVINTGIMLERLTNGRIPVGWHRVVAEEGVSDERFSIVQFCHPSPWTQLVALQTCVTDERPLKYAAIESGDLLDQVLWDINLIG